MEKLSRTEAITLLREYIKTELVYLRWFKAIRPFVKAIVFYGSTAKRFNTATSDVDILIFVPLAMEKKYTAGEYVYSFKDREINIVLRSIERLRRLARSPSPFEAEVFRQCEVLFEPDGEVRQLIEHMSSSSQRVNLA